MTSREGKSSCNTSVTRYPCKVGCVAALVRTAPGSVWSAKVTLHSLSFYFQFNTMHRLRRCSHVFKPDFTIITRRTLSPHFTFVCRCAISLLSFSLFSLRVPGVSVSKRADTHPAPLLNADPSLSFRFTPSYRSQVRIHGQTCFHHITRSFVSCNPLHFSLLTRRRLVVVLLGSNLCTLLQNAYTAMEYIRALPPTFCN